MFAEDLASTCAYSRIECLKPDMSDIKMVCRAYPDGIPWDAPCMQMCDVLTEHETPPQCPNGVTYKMSEQYRKRCQSAIDAKNGKRSWDGIPG